MLWLLGFLVSMGLTIVSFALGVIDIPILDASDVDPGHSGGVDAPDAQSGVSPFNLATLLAFATWFSGTGFVLTGPLGFGTLTALVASTGVGLVGAAIVFLFLGRILLRGQTPYLRAEDYQAAGTLGRLSVAIRPGGTGELVFSRNGARHVSSAKSATGEPIARGTEVVVLRQENGVAFVEPLDALLGPPATRKEL
jgi:hypothetical protein